MARSIYIYDPKVMSLDMAKANASAMGIAELVAGVPPRLAGELNDLDLPIVYAEPDPPPVVIEPTPLELLETRYAHLEAKVNEMETKTNDYDVIKTRLAELEAKAAKG